MPVAERAHLLFLQGEIVHGITTIEAYIKFKTSKKTEVMSMLNYIVEFKLSNIDTEALLALKLLYNANLTEHQKQLALTACPPKNYETMKNVLTRIFTTAKTELQINNEVEIKKKKMMITENCGRGRKLFRGFMYRGARYKRCSRINGRGPERMIPVFNGVISRCDVCELTHHKATDCPHANKSVNMTENINITHHSISPGPN